jgi:hypothetical protein
MPDRPVHMGRHHLHGPPNVIAYATAYDAIAHAITNY